MLDKILTVKPEDELTALCKRCEGCGERVAIKRVAVSLARGHSRFFCSDRCGDAARQRRSHIAKTAAVPSPLKWAGSKRWAVDKLRTIYRFHRKSRLVEPFAGAMNVALGLRPTEALLGDASPASIAFFSALSRGLVIPDHIVVDCSKETYWGQPRYAASDFCGDWIAS